MGRRAGKTIVGARIARSPDDLGMGPQTEQGSNPLKMWRIITSLAFEAAVGAFEAGLGDYIAQI